MLYEYKFKLEEGAGPEIKIAEKSKWSGRFNVYIGGSSVDPVREKIRFYPVAMPDGAVKKMVIKNVIFDPVPKVEIDGKEILLARKLFWYEHFLAFFLPAILLLGGGAIGGACGGAAVYFNYRVLRSCSSWPEKIFKLLGISLAAFLCCVFVFFIIFGFIRGAAGGPVIPAQ